MNGIWLFPLGIGVGIIAAILGIGGGLVMVPVLNLVGASPLQATATSLVGVFLGATSATLQNYGTGSGDPLESTCRHASYPANHRIGGQISS
jgi:Domain of unknown function DUF81.